MQRGRRWLRRPCGSILQLHLDCWTTSRFRRSFHNRRSPRNAWPASRSMASTPGARAEAFAAPRRPTRTCPVFRSRRPSIRTARKQPVVGRPRKAITAKRNPLAIQRRISPTSHPSRRSSAKTPAPIAPRSRAGRRRRKQRRRRGTPCPSCGNPTARSLWLSAYRHGQRSPNWTPSRQRRHIPSRRS
jgi:hypothetical protein